MCFDLYLKYYYMASKFFYNIQAIMTRFFFTPKLSRCDITGILLEMDRILRPEGTAIIRDTVDVLTKVQAITKRMRWESRIMDHEDGPFNPEKVLMAVKTYWTAEAEEEH